MSAPGPLTWASPMRSRPPQLGELARAMADAGVNIEVLYSDHDHRLILLVDDPAAGRRVVDAWQADLPDREPRPGAA